MRSDLLDLRHPFKMDQLNALTHRTLAVKFWPYAFYHAMRLSNAFPEAAKDKSPIQLTNPSGKAEKDLSKLRTFGCRTWIKPPGARDAKLVPNS